MDDRDRLGTGRWICCYWQEKFEALRGLPRQAGLVPQGVLMLPPPVEDLAQLEGLWDALNEELGTLIDVAEEEDLPEGLLATAASIASEFAGRVRAAAARTFSSVAGQQVTPDPGRIVAGHLQELLAHDGRWAGELNRAGAGVPRRAPRRRPASALDVSGYRLRTVDSLAPGVQTPQRRHRCQGSGRHSPRGGADGGADRPDRHRRSEREPCERDRRGNAWREGLTTSSRRTGLLPIAEAGRVLTLSLGNCFGFHRCELDFGSGRI